MNYSSEETETFHYFSDDEEKIIDAFLRKRGYKWGRATPCGNCCGIYDDEYWVDEIGGTFKDEDKKAFYELAKKKGITCSIENGSSTFSLILMWMISCSWQGQTGVRP